MVRVRLQGGARLCWEPSQLGRCRRPPTHPRAGGVFSDVGLPGLKKFRGFSAFTIAGTPRASLKDSSPEAHTRNYRDLTSSELVEFSTVSAGHSRVHMTIAQDSPLFCDSE